MDRMANVAGLVGYTRAIVWGSIALGDYVQGQSDIDLLLVSHGKSLDHWNTPLGTMAGQGEWDLDVLAITEEALSSSSPVALRHANPGMPYELHGMDLIQLRDWSVPIAGACIRDLLAYRDTRSAARSALRYAIEVMVPHRIEALSTEAADMSLDDQCLSIAFVLIRCLYSVKQGAVTSKRTAATWACEEYRTDSRYSLISEAGARLLGYREGRTRRLPLVSDLAALAEAIGEASDSMARLER
jgi:hypothetical protein